MRVLKVIVEVKNIIVIVIVEKIIIIMECGNWKIGKKNKNVV